MKKSILAILLAVAFLTPQLMLVAPVMAKGGGGGRSGGFSGSRSVSRPSTSAPKPTTTAPKPTTTAPKPAPKPVAPKVSTKPTTSTKTTTRPATKVGGKTFSGKGKVVDSTYQSKFRGGYTAPIGSTVYYRDNGWLDWLPFYLIMTNQQHREAVVSEPAKDGQPAKETVVKEEGTDGMYVWNWIFSLLIVGGLIWLIVWWVNKLTTPKQYV